MRRRGSASHSIQSLAQMNNVGKVVGFYYNAADEMRGFLYDSAADLQGPIGHAVDLNTVVDANTIPAGWNIASGNDINDQGDIVGLLMQAGPVSSELEYCGCVIDMHSTPPQVIPIPDELLGPRCSAYQINEDGDVAGAYRLPDGTWALYLYNPGLYGNLAYGPMDLGVISPTNTIVLSDRIAGCGNSPGDPGYARVVAGVVNGVQDSQVFLLAPWTDSPPSTFANLRTVFDMNRVGTFCGEGWFDVVVHRRTTQVLAPYIRRLDGPAVPLNEGRQYNNPAKGINKNEDAISSPPADSSLTLYHADLGPLDINALVIGTAEDVSLWRAATRSVRDINDRFSMLRGADGSLERPLPKHFGQIVGYIQCGSVYTGYVLTPEPAP